MSAAGKQVITVGPDGSMSGLQVKPGKGVDLRQFGKASIVRASEIVWDEDPQAWTVVIQDAPGLEAIKGLRVTFRMAVKARVSGIVSDMAESGACRKIEDTDVPLLFADYDDAVRFEIAYLDAWRLRGRH